MRVHPNVRYLQVDGAVLVKMAYKTYCEERFYRLLLSNEMF